jgi:hypothetical protein
MIYREGGKAPKFPEKPSIKMVSGKVVMSVIVEAAPQPTVTWFKGTTEISTAGNIRIYTEKGQAADLYSLFMEISVSKYLFIFLLSLFCKFLMYVGIVI